MTAAAVEVAALLLPVLAAAARAVQPAPRRPAAVRAAAPAPGRRQAGR